MPNKPDTAKKQIQNNSASCVPEQNTIGPEVVEILEALPKEKRNAFLAMVCARIDSYSGPLPRAEQVEIYNRCIPNGGDRLMAVVEAQASSRKENERKLVDAKIRLDKTGQIFGFCIGIFGMTMGTIAACSGHDVFGGIVAGTTVVSLVSAFVVGSISKRK
jgi:uncharacterized membrane protein